MQCFTRFVNTLSSSGQPGIYILCIYIYRERERERERENIYIEREEREREGYVKPST